MKSNENAEFYINVVLGNGEEYTVYSALSLISATHLLRELCLKLDRPVKMYSEDTDELIAEINDVSHRTNRTVVWNSRPTVAESTNNSTESETGIHRFIVVNNSSSVTEPKLAELVEGFEKPMFPTKSSLEMALKAMKLADIDCKNDYDNSFNNNWNPYDDD